MPGGHLPRADTELMILRTAHNCASDYEWRAHENLARNAGLTGDQVQQIRAGPDASTARLLQRLAGRGRAAHRRQHQR
jgi:alkylhydroperoxidase family enzyme